ncbi:hypothetical protein ACQR31_25820, partial [Rhodococcus rhodochrous]|uniref:hypothetical protein n=1 Tax=Rhodococcus rhodochrous TaxID=1829 RepID=UPI003D0E92CC
VGLHSSITSGRTQPAPMPLLTAKSPKRIAFREKDGPNLWLITAIVALVAAVAVFIGGVVVSQARDATPTYQSVYVPENVLGGSQE